MMAENQTGHDDQDSPLIESIHLHTLPTLVIQNILRFLDSKSLRNLRVTCFNLKIMIDSSPSLMKKLRVLLQTYYQIEDIIKSEVDWKNIIIPAGSKFHPFDVTPVLKRFAPTITHIEISRIPYRNVPRPHPGTEICQIGRNQMSATGLFYVLNDLTGGCVESIRIEPDLNIRGLNGVRHYGLEFYSCMAHHEETLKKNLRGVRRLAFVGSHGESRIFYKQIMEIIIDLCESIVELELPFWYSWVFSPEKNVLYTESACKKLFSYVERMGRIGFRATESMTINFGSIQIEQFPKRNADKLCVRPLYPLVPSNLLNLVRLCDELNLKMKLFNIPFMALPDPNVMNATQIQRMNRFISSIILQIPIDLDDYGALTQNVYVPPLAQVNLIIPVQSARLEVIGLPSSLNLTSVHINGLSMTNTFGLSKSYSNTRQLFLCDVPDLDCFSEESPLIHLSHLEELNIINSGLKTSFSHPQHLFHSFFMKFKSRSFMFPLVDPVAVVRKILSEI